MINYEANAREIFSPMIDKYNLKFVVRDEEQFYIIGYGFALWLVVDQREGTAIRYASVNEDNEVRYYSLMYISKDRFTSEDREIFGKPTTFDDRILVSWKIINYGFMKHCSDILSGDKSWLNNYQDKGFFDPRETERLEPFFREQGFLEIR